MTENHIGDLASILGVVISIIGFFATVITILRSKSAAVRAEDAANAVYDRIRQFESIFDFSAAIASLEEIKRLHRENAWPVLPDRYAVLRKILISLRVAMPNLNEADKGILQNALVNLRDIEQRVERALSNPSNLNGARFNAVISGDIDSLHELLSNLKSSNDRDVNHGTR